jgi:hypothetical protein
MSKRITTSETDLNTLLELRDALTCAQIDAANTRSPLDFTRARAAQDTFERQLAKVKGE